MLLSNIYQPSDLRGLSRVELDTLCQEIREFIVEKVSAVGGHLGPNLGVVELTLAIHRVFNSPHDAILWDTGHQAYVHKIVTGRSSQFDELRQGGGLSGYPSREESPHDWIENSHASTSLSYAHGLATAFEAAVGARRRRVVAVIGDGATTGGMAFEGLNNLGHSGCPVVIVLNDNGRSYAPTVSKLGESLARLRINPHYLRQQNRAERLIRELPIVGHQMERALDAVKAGVREMWEPLTFFEHLGVRYTGPFDGHDIAGVERALRNAAQLNEPVVVHVLTEKGRGHGPAENDPIKRMHDTSALKEGSYTEAFAETLIKIAERRPEVVALTAAMPDSTGLLQFAERFPDRCFDVGIAEQHAVTAAAGMAMGGLRPVVAIYSTFLTRAIDQVNLDVGLLRQPVVFALDRAGITGDDGASHHGVLDMVLLTKIPGMTLMAPSSYQELQVMLEDALEIESGPVAIRWSKTAAPHVEETDIGSGLRARRVMREGVLEVNHPDIATDVNSSVADSAGASAAGSGSPSQDGKICILAVGKMLTASKEAAETLTKRGIKTTVWDVRIVTPPDEEMLKDAAHHDLVITVEDGLKFGGAGEHITRKMNELHEKLHKKLHKIGAKSLPDAKLPPDVIVPDVIVLGVPQTYIPHGSADTILSSFGLDAKGIIQTATDWIAR